MQSYLSAEEMIGMIHLPSIMHDDFIDTLRVLYYSSEYSDKI